MNLSDLIKPKTKFTGKRKHNLEAALSELERGEWVTTEQLAKAAGVERKKISVVLLDLQKFGYNIVKRINDDYRHWFYEYHLEK